MIFPGKCHLQVFHDCENHFFPQTPSSSIKPSPSGPNRQVPKSLHSLSGANHRKTQGKGRKNEVKAAGAHVRSSSSSSSCLIHTSAFLHAGAIPSALSRKLATGRGSSSHTGGCCTSRSSECLPPVAGPRRRRRR